MSRLKAIKLRLPVMRNIVVKKLITLIQVMDQSRITRKEIAEIGSSKVTGEATVLRATKSGATTGTTINTKTGMVKIMDIITRGATKDTVNQTGTVVARPIVGGAITVAVEEVVAAVASMDLVEDGAVDLHRLRLHRRTARSGMVRATFKGEKEAGMSTMADVEDNSLVLRNSLLRCCCVPGPHILCD